MFRPFHKMAFLLLLLFAVTTVADQHEDSLRAEARQLAVQNRKQWGQEYYRAYVDDKNHLVFVSALTENQVKETAAVLAKFATACRPLLSNTKWPWNIVIILPTKDDYEARYPNTKVLGHFNSNTHRIVSIDRGRVLRHEFAHALLQADAATAGYAKPYQTWVEEGFASLLESASITGNEFKPVLDTRLITLRNAISNKDVLPLEKFIAQGQSDFMKNAKVNYAQARYLMLYLYEKGLLKSWYKTYKDAVSSDPTGKAALEKILDKPLSRINDDWQEWVLSLQLSSAARSSANGLLGVRVKDVSGKVKIVEITEDSPAAKAGRLKVGDIIEGVDGKPVANSAALFAIIRDIGAKKTVKIIVRRRGRKVEVVQPLGDASEK